MKFTAAVALASACVVVWCAVGAARKGVGSRERPRPSFVPYIDTYPPLMNMGGNTWTAARQ